VLVSTCTGSLCPGLTSYLTESLNLRADVLGLDLVGQGCGAALPNLATAAALIRANQARRVLSVCVEVCSAAMYLDDDPGVLISACLFGDGAAAAVLADTPAEKGCQVEWRDSFSLTAPQDRELLRFEKANGCLRNILRPEVPERAAAHADTLRRRALAHTSGSADSLAAHVLHPGGRNVLRALARRLELSESDLQWSAGVLRDYGNLSSPSVLFGLKRAFEGGAPEGCWWMSSFGAGFSCHGALLRVQRVAA
jgi:alkylresorcinol/alkylpyrone synthase